MVDPWKGEGVKLVDLYALLPERREVAFAQRTVVAAVAEGIEQRPYLNTLLGFLGQEVEEERGYGVVAEIEIFKVHAAARLLDGLEHVVKLLLSAHEKRHAVVVRERHALLSQLHGNQRVAGHGLTAFRSVLRLCGDNGCKTQQHCQDRCPKK